MPEPHEWAEVQFSWGSYIECACGYRPESQEELDAHNPQTVIYEPGDNRG